MDETKIKGVFITFEGPEGGGKTTQIQLLATFLRENGYEVLATREPGGTGMGISVRNILLDPSFEKMDQRAELMLFAADRAQHVSDLIRPALQAGKVVLCDRYTDSTIAYQVGGRGFSPELISMINSFSSYDVRPDLTLLLDVPYQIGIKRATKIYSDRFEQEKQQFHERIREMYLKLRQEDPDRIHLLDTSKDHIEIVQRQIRQILLKTELFGKLNV
ncbi:MAG: dTMP kinase [Candidatus Margulisiibacteriota bacterium]